MQILNALEYWDAQLRKISSKDYVKNKKYIENLKLFLNSDNTHSKLFAKVNDARLTQALVNALKSLKKFNNIPDSQILSPLVFMWYLYGFGKGRIKISEFTGAETIDTVLHTSPYVYLWNTKWMCGSALLSGKGYSTSVIKAEKKITELENAFNDAKVMLADGHIPIKWDEKEQVLCITCGEKNYIFGHDDIIMFRSLDPRHKNRVINAIDSFYNRIPKSKLSDFESLTCANVVLSVGEFINYKPPNKRKIIKQKPVSPFASKSQNINEIINNTKIYMFNMKYYDDSKLLMLEFYTDEQPIQSYLSPDFLAGIGIDKADKLFDLLRLKSLWQVEDNIISRTEYNERVNYLRDLRSYVNFSRKNYK